MAEQRVKVALYLASAKLKKQRVIREFGQTIRGIVVDEPKINTDTEVGVIFGEPGPLNLQHSKYPEVKNEAHHYSKIREFRRQVIGHYDRIRERTGRGGCICIDAGFLRPNSPDQRRHTGHWWWRADGYFKAGWYDRQYRFDFRTEGVPSDRFDKLGYELKPWRTDGEHIVIAAMSAGDHYMLGQDVLEWCDGTIATIRKYTNRPIMLRHHPNLEKEYRRWHQVVMPQGSIYDALKDAWALVTPATTCAVEALLEGIPTFSLHWSCPGYAAAGHDLSRIENPPMPDRRPWTNALGYSQWTVLELKQGLAWQHLNRDQADRS